MGKFLLGVVFGALAFFVYDRHNDAGAGARAAVVEEASPLVEGPERPEPPAAPRYQCDGRTHCSQMTSCEEAEFFLSNCPDMKMDGDHDGLPCEEQHCRHKR